MCQSGQIKSIKHCLQISKTEINEDTLGVTDRGGGSPRQLIPFHAIPIKVPPGFFLFLFFFLFYLLELNNLFLKFSRSTTDFK